MTAVAREVLAVVAALLITAAAVGPGGDRGLLVPPPEAAAENFLRALAEHRYSQARQHLASDLRAIEGPELAALQRALEGTHGRVEKVQGEDAETRGEVGLARASLRFSRGRHDVPLPVRREHGLWKVANLDALRELAASGNPRVDPARP